MLVARSLGLVVLVFAALCPATASEARASEPVTLRWSAPADCPTGHDVLAEVNRLLGARASADQSTLDVAAEVQRKDDGTYQVRLEIPGADGPRVREVSAVSCVALGQAAALILAMMVDPEAALAAPPAPDSTGPTPPGPTPPTQALPGPTESKDTTPERRPVEPPRLPTPVTPPPLTLPTMTSPTSPRPEMKAPVARRRPLFSPSVQGFVDVGSLPSPAFGWGGAVGVFPGRWRFELGAAYFFEVSGQFLTLSKAGSNVNLWAFHGAGGYAFLLRPELEFIPRVRIDVGRLDAASFGVSDIGEGAGAFVGLGIGGVVSVPLTQSARARIGVDGIVRLAYPQFIVTGVGLAHEPSLVVGRLSLGLEWRL